MSETIEVLDFGISPYRTVWEQQKQLFHKLIEDKRNGIVSDKNYLLTGQHPAVYTLGFHGNENNMLVTREQLAHDGVELIRIERGGDITFHGPGQLIAYPIIDLERYGIGVKRYVNLLEECVIRLLSLYGIEGCRVEGAPGIWIGAGTPDERKICAIGVKCSRYITMHGIALNVSTDLSAFTKINPCGFADKGVTSMCRELSLTLGLSRDLSFDSVKQDFIRIFRTLFRG